MRALVVALALIGRVAQAAPPERAVFALIVGVNRSVDRSSAELHYADDDAAQYLALFRALGARTYLLSRFDANSTQLFPQAIAEAHDPTLAELKRSVEAVAADVAQARAHGVEAVFYFVYAGHGNVRDGEGYIALEDARLDARAIEHDIVERVHADQAHLVIDACYSFFLAYGRGPGGSRQPISGFSKLSGLATRGQIGLLLSTSSARESHEWEAFQAGVFSHEVRSGLYGAADSDGDGVVTYREIAAFVERANAAIPNERFRPDVFARPPSSTGELLDLRGGLARRIDIDAAHQAHYLLEDARGVRLAELHNGQAVHLVRPIASGTLYLRRTDDDVEYVIPASDGVVTLASLEPAPLRVHERGAAHEAFGTIFSLPYDQEVAAAFRFRAAPDAYVPSPAERRALRRRNAGIGVLSLGGVALVSGAAVSLSALSLRSSAGSESQRAASATNRDIDHRNLAAGVLYGVSGAAAITGAVLMLLPPRWARFSFTASATTIMAGYGAAF